MSSPYIIYRLKLKNGEIPPPEKKPRAKIKPYSDKRSKLNRQYAKVSKPKWEGEPCGVKSPVCVFWAYGMHHPEGKDTPEKLLDPDNQLPCCVPCNGWLEQNDAQARELGFKKSRMNTKRFNNK